MHKIKVEYYNVLYPYMNDNPLPERIVKELVYYEDTTIQELFEMSEQSCADLSNYYNLSERLYYNNGYFPYIIQLNGRIVFNQSYRKTKVDDFLYTHGITDGIIHADTGIPQAGGPDLKDLYDMWAQVYSILEQIGTLVGLSLGVTEFVKWIKSIFKKKTLPPQTVFDLLLSKKQWNHIELSNELGIDVEDVKKLLQLSCFKWDRTKMLYVLDGDVDKIREKLLKILIYKYE